MHLGQTVAFLKGDRKFPISVLTQPTAENADCWVWCESALRSTAQLISHHWTSAPFSLPLDEYALKQNKLDGFQRKEIFNFQL